MSMASSGKEVEQDDEQTIADGEIDLAALQEELDAIRSEAESANATARRAQKRVLELRETVADQSERIDDLEAENEDLRQELGELRDRTGLLEHVKEASSLKPEKRAAVLIQTLYNTAWQRRQSDANVNPRATMDYKAAEGALGGAVTRDKIYRTFQKAEDLVDDSDLVRFVKEDRGAPKNSRLVLDLDGGSVPRTIGGKSITPPGDE